MKTIVFIETNKSDSSYEAIKAADRMQYYIVLLTDRETLIENKRLEYPNVHLIEYCDLSNIDEVKNCINSLLKKDLDIKAIVSFIEPYCHTASVLAQDFGLKYFSAEAISTMLNKIESRKALDGIQEQPCFYEINTLSEKTIEKFPVVLKIPVSAGSKDVYKVETYEEYEDAYHEIRECYPNEPILVEEYLEGSQYLVETVTINNKTNIVAIIKQEITFTGRFIVTGYQIILDHESELFQSLKEAASVIISKFELKNGPCHLEMRYVQNEWKLIEANPRVSGGAINLLIETACGVNLVEETLKFALGLEPNFDCKFKKETFLKYLIVPQEGILIKVTGKNNALECNGVRHVYIKPKKCSVIIPPISMSSRYAYIIATGNSAIEAKENAEQGAAQIKFHLSMIDGSTFCNLSGKERRLINIARRNKRNIDKIAPFFNNFIVKM